MNRYERQVKMIGEEGQRALANAMVTIAGVGGLGTVAATYLAYAGAHNFRLIDHDAVSLSNLNRQIMYNSADVRKRKVFLAEIKLRDIFSGYTESNTNFIGEDNVDELIEGSTVVLDCMDNEESRKILCRSAVKQNIPLIYGAVCGWTGMVITIDKSACPWCFFGEDVAIEEKSILGATCGIIGSTQALEAIKIITGKGNPLLNRVLFWSGFNSEAKEVLIDQNKECLVCGNQS